MKPEFSPFIETMRRRLDAVSSPKLRRDQQLGGTARSFTSIARQSGGKGQQFVGDLFKKFTGAMRAAWGKRHPD